jgi:hypothetical protein
MMQSSSWRVQGLASPSAASPSLEGSYGTERASSTGGVLIQTTSVPWSEILESFAHVEHKPDFPRSSMDDPLSPTSCLSMQSEPLFLPPQPAADAEAESSEEDISDAVVAERHQLTIESWSETVEKLRQQRDEKRSQARLDEAY